MAKKQTRRSISVSRTTYERLKAFCEANNVSMSQFVETRVGDFLGGDAPAPAPRPSTGGGGGGGGGGGQRPEPRTTPSTLTGGPGRTQQAAPPIKPAAPVPMTSAAARYAVEPPPPIIKPKGDHDQPAPAPIVKTADQIFTF
jgi:hypothetical protein